MQTIVLYRYIREDGGVTTSPIKPDCDYTEKVRLVADEGKRLVLPDGTYALCADLETAEGVTEEDDPDYEESDWHEGKKIEGTLEKEVSTEDLS